MRQVFVKRGLKRATGLLLVLFLMAGCGETSGTSGNGSGQLQKAESEAKLLGYIRSALLQRYGVVNDRPAVPEAMATRLRPQHHRQILPVRVR